MPGGTFPMGRSVTSGSDTYANGFSNELPEHDATVAAFALDKYEVTVGRFRKFVEDFNAWHVETDNPADNAGANPNVDQATATSDTGWGRSWDASQVDFPTSASKLTERLKCIEGDYTWTDSPGSTVEESYPINCVSWYEAFAFCVWDGGRLPTEAEWEYAAAGGTQNRRYPWGAVRPDFDRTNYLSLNLLGPKLAVGSKLATGGTGYFGHADQAGSMWEWTFDRHNDVFYGTASAPIACVNCANAFTNSPNGSPNYPDDSGSRTLRGGCWFCNETEIRAAQRTFYGPEWRYSGIGLRCARDVK
jgi:formylglycine-generating enzyme required for sulfatase activity